MSAPCAATESSTPAAQSGGVPGGRKMRMEDPLNRYYRYTIARWIVRALMRTPVTPDQVTLVQPLFAALAGYLVMFDDPRALVAGALAFELRSILDCVDGALARAKSMVSPAGHAIDALADWLGVTFLCAGIFWHFPLHPPPGARGAPARPAASRIALIGAPPPRSGRRAPAGSRRRGRCPSRRRRRPGRGP
ncbi:CDP-alcohol phosphatidyltransferase family protein [Sorangium sp. So ce119]|uniref:CDP-alcohol phosphatidyltransferase family protein n=1 Tax=Sorangium sp. So ce119 TaxID=3133279 RepID=UPI003F61E48D